MYEFILKNDNKNLNVLELGAGTALPSIFCSHLGHKVIITDIKKNIEFIKNIINENSFENEVSALPIVKELNWENNEHIESIKIISEYFDVIIGSELIYMDEYFDDLIKVLKTFSSPTTKIILSYKIRLPELVDNFFNKFSQYFEYEHVDEKIVANYHPLTNKLKILIAKLKF
jgi:predicted nicotinamide N-methyase